MGEGGGVECTRLEMNVQPNARRRWRSKGRVVVVVHDKR